MSKNLYIGSLSYSTTESSLRSFFETVGEVSKASVISDRMSGRSRGFGFVEMATNEGAEKAVAELDGKELDGRAIKVSVAKEREERERGDNRRREGGFSGRRF